MPVTISVITVVFNGYEKITQTIESVVNQSYNYLDYVVIDGGSTDGTLDIVDRFRGSIATVVSEPDKGIYDAMNKGIVLAKGDWIIFMNCGDRFYANDTLEQFAVNLVDADLVYGDAWIEYETFGTTLPRYPLRQLWKEMPFCHQALFTRSAVMKNNPFDLRFRLSADYEFIYRASLLNYRFKYGNQIVCRFDNTDGLSKRNPLSSYRERIQIALEKEPSALRAIYLRGRMFQVALRYAIKKIIGNTLTQQITEWIRKT
jgi:glycosyltransferase involved in cell wall biosynthesis